MEQLILNLFQEHLSKYIIGFRKEQINANVFNGKGSINDIELNCSIFNEHLRNVTSMIEIQRIYISKISFYISSYTNLKHMPIHIDIDHISIDLVESFYYETDIKKRKRIRQLTKLELQQCIRDGLLPSSSSNQNTTTTNATVSSSQSSSKSQQYNLLDRIIDNIMIEIQSITIQYQIYGCNMKTKRTHFHDTTTTSTTGNNNNKRIVYIQPPILQIEFYNIRWVTMNEYGDEIDTTSSTHNKMKQQRQQQQSRTNNSSKTGHSQHHHNHSHHNRDTIFIYKQLELDYHISLLVVVPDMNDDDTMTNTSTQSSQKTTTTRSIPIISSIFTTKSQKTKRNINSNRIFDPMKQVRMYVTVQRRIYDSEYLAFQLDMVIPYMEILLCEHHHYDNTDYSNNEILTTNDNSTSNDTNPPTTTSSSSTTTTTSLSIPQQLNAIVHFATALQFCMKKNRSYVDPFKPAGRSSSGSNVTTTTTTTSTVTTTTTLISDSVSTSTFNEVDVNNNSTDGDNDQLNSGQLDHGGSIMPSSLLDLTLADGLSDDDEDDDEEDTENDEGSENNPLQLQQQLPVPTTASTSNLPSMQQLDSKSTAIDKESMHGSIKNENTQKVNTSVAAKPNVTDTTIQIDRKPLLVLSNGIVIHNKFSISCNIHNIQITGQYPNNNNNNNDNNMDGKINNQQKLPIDIGEIQCKMNGFIVEAIWPLITQEKGGYLQISVSKFSLYEIFDHRVRPVVLGGYGDSTNNINNDNHIQNTPSQQKTNHDSNDEPLNDHNKQEHHIFPKLEDRSIRLDPFHLRQQVVHQSFSSKFTISYTDNKSTSELQDTKVEIEKEEFLIFPEIGIDQVQFMLDAEIWSRMVRYLLNIGCGGYDQRWWSGDYSKYITPEMLVNPDSKFEINDYLILNSEKELLQEPIILSSDRFRTTIQLSNSIVRLQGVREDNIMPCDVVVRCNELIVQISSDLSQKLIMDDIPVDSITFPHDPSDKNFPICARTNKSNHSKHPDKDNESLVTLRMKVAFQCLSVDAVPIVPFHLPSVVERIVYPTDITALLLAETTLASDNNIHHNDQSHLKVSTSFIIHDAELDFDIELLASIAMNLVHHVDIIEDLLKAYKAQISIREKDEDNDPTVTEQLLLTNEQHDEPLNYIYQLWKNGGIVASVYMNIALFKANIRKRCVPRQRQSTTTFLENIEVCPQLTLLCFSLSGFAFHLDVISNEVDSMRLLSKISVRETYLKICDFNHVVHTDSFWIKLDDQMTSMLASSSIEPPLFPLFTFGSDECDALKLRIELYRGDNQWLSFAADVLGGQVDTNSNLISAVMLLITDTLLTPCNTSWLQTRFVSQLNPFFPNGTLGFIVTLPIASILARSAFVRDTKQSNTFGTYSVTNTNLKLLVESFLSKLEQNSVDILLIRLDVKNLHAFVSDATGRYRLRLLDSNVFISYLIGDSINAEILNVFTKDQTNWLSFIKDKNVGLYSSCNIRQSVDFLGGEHGNGIEQLKELPVIDEFDIKISYYNSNILLSISDNFAVRDKSKFLNLFMSMRNLVQQYQSLPSLISGQPNVNLSETCIPNSELDPIQHSCLSSISALKTLRRLVLMMQQRLNSIASESKSIQEEREAEIARLRMLLFLKEKELFGLHALISSEEAGWLRLGTPQQSGLRGSMSCTVWPHWVVLHRSLLLLYTTPGQSGIVNILSLAGASLHEVSGGKNKRELKRAFGIMERCGTIHVMIAKTDMEYLTWVSAINKAIHIYTSVDTNTSKENPVFESDDHQPSDHGASTTRKGDTSIQGRQLGRSLAKVVQVAKEKGKSVVTRGNFQNPQNMSDQTSDIDFEKVDAPSKGDANPRIQQLQSRLAGMGNVTKSRFGSALNAAKQKGKEVAQRRRQSGLDSTSLTSSESHVISYTTAANSWSCKMCTFENAPYDGECQICQFKRPSGDEDTSKQSREAATSKHSLNCPNPMINETIEKSEHLNLPTPKNQGNYENTIKSDDQSFISDIPDDDDLNRFEQEPHGGIKSRLGAVIKRAKIAATEGQRLGRHNVRTENQQDVVVGTNGFKINNVTLNGVLKMSKYPFGEGPKQIRGLHMKKLDGIWTITVNAFQEMHELEKLDKKISHELDEENPSNGSADIEKGIAGNSKSIHTGSSFTDCDHESRPDSDDSTLSQFIDLTFTIKVVKHDFVNSSQEEVIELTRSLSEVASLHVSLSEALSQVPMNTFDTLAKSSIEYIASNILIENVRTIGRLLSGHLDLQYFVGSVTESMSKYYSNVISQFLNDLIRSPLPLDGLALLSDFLKLPNAVTNNARCVRTNFDANKFLIHKSKFSGNPMTSILSDFSSIITRSESEIANAIAITTMMSHISKVHHRVISTSNSVESTSLGNGSNSSQLLSRESRDCWYHTVNSIMVQRDEVEFQKVRSDILRQFELDDQRREIEDLKSSIKLMKKIEIPPQAIDKKSETVKNRKVGDNPEDQGFNGKVSYDADSELLSLCQQLTSEIAARTAAEMEVIRLREIRHIERNQEAAERKKLENENFQLKQKLQETSVELLDLKIDRQKWKESFETVAQFSEERNDQ